MSMAAGRCLCHVCIVGRRGLLVGCKYGDKFVMVQICRWKNDIFFLLLFCGVFLCCCRAWVGCIFLHGCRMALPGVWGWLKRKKARLAARVLLCGGDSDRIQTCNLLIRSQMLYSVKLRSQMRMQRYNYFFKLYIFGGKKSFLFYDGILLGWCNILCNSTLVICARCGAMMWQLWLSHCLAL